MAPRVGEYMETLACCGKTLSKTRWSNCKSDFFMTRFHHTRYAHCQQVFRSHSNGPPRLSCHPPPHLIYPPPRTRTRRLQRCGRWSCMGSRPCGPREGRSSMAVVWATSGFTPHCQTTAAVGLSSYRFTSCRSGSPTLSWSLCRYAFPNP